MGPGSTLRYVVPQRVRDDEEKEVFMRPIADGLIPAAAGSVTPGASVPAGGAIATGTGTVEVALPSSVELAAGLAAAYQAEVDFFAEGLKPQAPELEPDVYDLFDARPNAAPAPALMMTLADLLDLATRELTPRLSRPRPSAFNEATGKKILAAEVAEDGTRLIYPKDKLPEQAPIDTTMSWADRKAAVRTVQKARLDTRTALRLARPEGTASFVSAVQKNGRAGTTPASVSAEPTTALERQIKAQPGMQIVKLSGMEARMASVLAALGAAPADTVLSPTDAVVLARYVKLSPELEKEFVDLLLARALEIFSLAKISIQNIRDVLTPLANTPADQIDNSVRSRFGASGSATGKTSRGDVATAKHVLQEISQFRPDFMLRLSSAPSLLKLTSPEFANLDPASAYARAVEDLLWGHTKIPAERVAQVFNEIQERILVDLRALQGQLPRRGSDGDASESTGAVGAGPFVTAPSSAADAGRDGGEGGGDQPPEQE